MQTDRAARLISWPEGALWSAVRATSGRPGPAKARTRRGQARTGPQAARSGTTTCGSEATRGRRAGRRCTRAHGPRRWRCLQAAGGSALRYIGRPDDQPKHRTPALRRKSCRACRDVGRVHFYWGHHAKATTQDPSPSVDRAGKLNDVAIHAVATLFDISNVDGFLNHARQFREGNVQ